MLKKDADRLEPLLKKAVSSHFKYKKHSIKRRKLFAPPLYYYFSGWCRDLGGGFTSDWIDITGIEFFRVAWLDDEGGSGGYS